MQLLTENATVAQSKTQDEAMEDTYEYTQQLHIDALSKKKHFLRLVYARGKFKAREICTF